MKAEKRNETSTEAEEQIETGAQRVTHVPPGEGESVWAMGDTYTFKATSEDTGGELLVFEASVPPGGGPPPHIHHREDEAFYVVEGELEFLKNDCTFRVGVGSFVHIPEGTLHRFENVGTKPARMAVLCTPAGFERFFREVSQPATDGETAPPPGSEDIEKALVAGPEYGLELPPPPEESPDFETFMELAQKHDSEFLPFPENEVNGGITHLPSGEGTSIWLLDDLYTFKATNEDTDGKFTLWEETSPPQADGPPPHIHYRKDEAFYVVKGELEFMEGDRTFEAGGGSFVYIPKGTLHAFRNVGTTTAKFVVMVTPAGLEEFFFEVGEPATDGSSSPEGPPDIERITATASKYDIDVPQSPEGTSHGEER